MAYGRPPTAAWEPFARLILEASYEATLRVAAARGPAPVFLTLIGGGVFGNRIDWILDALLAARSVVDSAGLDLRLVSHGGPNPALARHGID